MTYIPKREPTTYQSQEDKITWRSKLVYKIGYYARQFGNYCLDGSTDCFEEMRMAYNFEMNIDVRHVPSLSRFAYKFFRDVFKIGKTRYIVVKKKENIK